MIPDEAKHPQTAQRGPDAIYVDRDGKVHEVHVVKNREARGDA